MKKNNKIIIISSPSGAGKTTICKRLLKKIKNIEISISYTTRPKRKNEKNGKDYFFINKKDFLKFKRKRFFIETSRYIDFYYGSPYENIEKAFNNNNHILFDVDWKGAETLRKKFPKSRIIDIFILPPNIKELRSRLIKRGRDNKKQISKRLALAESEIKRFRDYKFVLVNDDLTKTVNILVKVINNKMLLKKINYKNFDI